MRIEKLKWITREIVQANPDKIFLFGDNLERVGMGGQAGAMRGEPNSIGIPTKKAPGMRDEDFFTDDEFNINVAQINRDIEKAIDLALQFGIGSEHGVTIVIPSDGLGTGLAELDKRAPRTFAYLKQALAGLEG